MEHTNRSGNRVSRRARTTRKFPGTRATIPGREVTYHGAETGKEHLTGRELLDVRISEETFQQTILTYARLRGWRCYHTHDSRRSAAGYPDLTLVRNGTLIFAELKSTRGKLTTEQEAWGRDLVNCLGVQWYEWRPKDWRLITAVLY